VTLFRLAGEYQSVANRQPTLRTPHGDLLLACAVRTRDLHAADETWEHGDTRLYLWHDRHAEVGLALFPFVHPQQAQLAVDAAWAAVWRIDADCDVDRIVFTCSVTEPEHWPVGDLDGGEDLVAVGFESPDGLLFIGTGDEDVVRDDHGLTTNHDQYEGDRTWLPLVEATAHGIRVELPDLGFGRGRYEHRVVVAWSGHRTQDIAPWYAVDQRRAVIIDAHQICQTQFVPGVPPRFRAIAFETGAG
jgi:hypothetical protein